MLTVLLVDDEAALLEMAVRYLSADPEMSLVTARSVDEALAILATKAVDAIVSDYEMPGEDGIAFLKRIRGRGETVPFILFTGRGREVVAMQALNYGADFYLQKGVDAEAVFAELRNMIAIAAGRRRAVAEAKALAERVEHQAQVLDEILSSIPDPVIIIDPDGFVTYANIMGAKVLGFPRTGILGRHVRDLGIPEGSAAPLLAALEEVFRSGGQATAEIPWDGAGSVTRYRCSVSPLHTTTGRINAADVIFHDITDETRIADELQECRVRVNELLKDTRTTKGT